MSYLDLPHFHLCGKFTANPPTINNQALNYDPGTALVLGPRIVPGSVSWDASGIGVFTMAATVRTVLGADGSTVAADGLLGATLASSDAPVAAKLVNLDPQQQNTSVIYGMKLSLTLPGAAAPAFSGTVAPAPLADLWGRAVIGVGIEYAGGVYQSVVQVSWGDVSASPVLAALKERTADGMLSIRWAVDGFDARQGELTFGQGRVVATVGPYLQGEPCHFLAQRRLLAVSPPVPQPPAPPLSGYAAGLWYAPFQVGPGVNGSPATLVLDLANAVATTDRYGGAPLFQEIQVSLDAYGASTVLGSLPFNQDVHENCAGVLVFPLDAGQLATVQHAAVGVTGLPHAGPVRQLQSDGTVLTVTPTSTSRERQDGALAALEPAFLRLEPGAPQTVALWVREFGVPVSRTVDLVLAQTANSDSLTGVTVEGKGTVPSWVGSTDTAQLAISTPAGPIPWEGQTALVPVENGAASLALVCTGEISGARSVWRQEVDGEVYFLTSSLWPELLTRSAAVPLMSILAFDVFTPGDPPTWYGDVQPILAQYSRLYPGMRSILDIADLDTLQQPFFDTGMTGAQLVARALSLDIGDPNHMPVTRDLSAARRAAILTWIGNGSKDLGTPRLEAAVQPVQQLAEGPPPPALPSQMLSV
jgi:hypothetical protein